MSLGLAWSYRLEFPPPGARARPSEPHPQSGLSSPPWERLSLEVGGGVARTSWLPQGGVTSWVRSVCPASVSPNREGKTALPKVPMGCPHLMKEPWKTRTPDPYAPLAFSCGITLGLCWLVRKVSQGDHYGWGEGGRHCLMVKGHMHAPPSSWNPIPGLLFQLGLGACPF